MSTPEELLRQTQAELAELHNELDRRVHDAISLYQLDGTHSVVLDDRRRIAEDFHDRVIQGIFGAILQLHGMRLRVEEIETTGTGQPITVEELTRIMAELDAATKEARHSIYTLTTMPTSSTGESVIHDTVTRAGLILGSTPNLVVQGDLHSLPAELLDEVATVLREALTNVAKHASASEVTVDVGVADERVTLVVSDDGVGIPESPSRSSGTANLRRRAERRGGSANWARRQPSGTVFTWVAKTT